MLEANGYALHRGVLGAEEVALVIEGLEAGLNAAGTDRAIKRARGRIYAARNLGTFWSGLGDLATRLQASIPLEAHVGGPAQLVRALYFDKPPGRSWTLPWHRDRMVAVNTTPEFQGIQTLHRLDGVPHLRADAPALRRVLTLRVHLDSTDMDNGALLVAPGSHLESVTTMPTDPPRNPARVDAQPGDVLLMRPLLLHRSQHTSPTPSHRRILHLEFASPPGPARGLDWAGALTR